MASASLGASSAPLATWGTMRVGVPKEQEMTPDKDSEAQTDKTYSRAALNDVKALTW
jgi:hypothetical protein